MTEKVVTDKTSGKTDTGKKDSGSEVAQVDLVALTIDGFDVEVPKGTLIIRAAEEAGIDIPRFCDHPGLDPVGACRQCLVEVWMPGPPGPDGTPGEARQMQGPPGRMKPQASCIMTVAPGMVVKTQYTSEAIDKAQHGVMEMLLINHPLDCPVCDKGGECPLQNQAMSNGRAVSRFEDVKRTYPKPINISSQVLLDRDRCILCARCTRFSEQVAGDPFIALVERGALQQVGIYEEQPFESYFSGNTVQICPVGALTGAAYRFRARPFDLVSTESVCEHCASGCAQRTDHRRGTVLRRMAALDPTVNEEWNCDKGRWAFTYPLVGDRLQFPMVREDGILRVASWPEALAAAADGLAAARETGVLVGGRVSVEDAFAYNAFAQQALGGADIDFRARPHSAEEAEFLLSTVRGTTPDNGAVTYTDLERAKSVLLVGFEPEDESPIVFLRLRKAFRKNKTDVYALAPLPTRGLSKVGGTLLAAAPGTEAQVLDGIRTGSSRATEAMTAAGDALRADGGIILVGERLGSVPGGLSAALRLAEETGARLAWIPRRAGERGALEAGALSGRGTAEMIGDALIGKLGGLVVGGVDPYDIVSAPGSETRIDTHDVLEALQNAFVVSLEVRESAVTEVADVVLPVAPHAEKAGSFVNWEGRTREFAAALASGAMSDHRVLDMLATEMGAPIGTRTLAAIRDQLGSAPAAAATAAPAREAAAVSDPPAGHVLLATWHHLLDMGRMQDGEPFLAGTAPATVAQIYAGTAAAFGLVDGDAVEVSTEAGSVVLPVIVTEDMVDHVLWLPTNSAGAPVRSALGVDAGAEVGLRKAADVPADGIPDGLSIDEPMQDGVE